MRVSRSWRRRCSYNTWQPYTVGALAVVALAALLIRIFISTWELRSAEVLLCDANGQIQEDNKGFRLDWEISSYFSINIPVLRRLPYKQAKIVDACWDLVFGRGGQVLAGMIAYCVVRDTVKLNMERSALPIPAVTLVLLQQQIQFTTIWELFRALFYPPKIQIAQETYDKRETRRRVLLCLFACSYVIAFATITSVMTGYFAEVEGFYISPTNDEPMTSLSEFTRAFFLLVDGERVGYSAGSTIGIGDIDGLSTKMHIDGFAGQQGVYDDSFRELIYEYWNSSADVPGPVLHEQGYNWSWNPFESDASRVFTSPDMPSNNSWSCKNGNCSFYLPPGSFTFEDLRSNITIGSQTFLLDAPPLNISHRLSVDQNLHHAEYESWNDARWIDDFWVHKETSTRFTYDAIKSLSSCIPHKEYSWGFSGQVLLTFILYRFFFAVALWGLRMDVSSEGQWCRRAQSYNIYSDVIAIAAALERIFGPEIDNIPLKLLEKRINEHRGGFYLQKDGIPLPEQVIQQHDTLIQAAETRGSNTRKEVKALVAEYNIRLLGSESSTMQDEETPSPNFNTQHSSGESPDTPDGYALAFLPKPAEEPMAQRTTATDLEVPDENVSTLSPRSSEGDVAQHWPVMNYETLGEHHPILPRSSEPDNAPQDSR